MEGFRLSKYWISVNLTGFQFLPSNFFHGNGFQLSRDSQLDALFELLWNEIGASTQRRQMYLRVDNNSL